MDSEGKERSRIEGYLPKDWFRARLEMGLARVAFMHKKFSDAQNVYHRVVQDYSNLSLAAEAAYWRGVCEYKAANDHTVLGESAKELSAKYPGTEWMLKSLPWAH